MWSFNRKMLWNLQKLWPTVCSFHSYPGTVFQFQFHNHHYVSSHCDTLIFHRSTHLAVMVSHSEQSNRAVGVAAVADGGHVSIPHDRDGSQRLARGVWMRNGVALPGGRRKLWAQRQVLLDLLILGLVEVELRVLQVAVYLQQNQNHPQNEFLRSESALIFFSHH